MVRAVFSTLRSDTSRSRRTAATKYRAPHKSLLLPAVIYLKDRLQRDKIKYNQRLQT